MNQELALEAARQPIVDWLYDFTANMSAIGSVETDPVAMVERVVRAYLEARRSFTPPAPDTAGMAAERLLADFGEGE